MFSTGSFLHKEVKTGETFYLMLLPTNVFVQTAKKCSHFSFTDDGMSLILANLMLTGVSPVSLVWVGGVLGMWSKDPDNLSQGGKSRCDVGKKKLSNKILV